MRELQGRVATLLVEQDDDRMHQHFAQQATAQMPQVTGPDPLDGTAVDELAKDDVDAVAQSTQLRAPARPGMALAQRYGANNAKPRACHSARKVGCQ